MIFRFLIILSSGALWVMNTSAQSAEGRLSTLQTYAAHESETLAREVSIHEEIIFFRFVSENRNMGFDEPIGLNGDALHFLAESVSFTKPNTALKGVTVD